MSIINFNIHKFPKFIIEYENSSYNIGYTEFLKINGFTSICFLGDRVITEKPSTHSLNEIEYIIFLLKWV